MPHTHAKGRPSAVPHRGYQAVETRPISQLYFPSGWPCDAARSGNEIQRSRFLSRRVMIKDTGNSTPALGREEGALPARSGAPALFAGWRPGPSARQEGGWSDGAVDDPGTLASLLEPAPDVLSPWLSPVGEGKIMMQRPRHALKSRLDVVVHGDRLCVPSLGRFSRKPDESLRPVDPSPPKRKKLAPPHPGMKCHGEQGFSVA